MNSSPSLHDKPRATLKNNAPRQHCTTEGHYFSMLIEANSQYLCCYHEINATNLCRHPRRSNIEYVLICLILRSD